MVRVVWLPFLYWTFWGSTRNKKDEWNPKPHRLELNMWNCQSFSSIKELAGSCQCTTSYYSYYLSIPFKQENHNHPFVRHFLLNTFTSNNGLLAECRKHKTQNAWKKSSAEDSKACSLAVGWCIGVLPPKEHIIENILLHDYMFWITLRNPCHINNATRLQ